MLVLGVWVFAARQGNVGLQQELLEMQEKLTAQQVVVQKLQSDLQLQQQEIESGAQLAQQVGPAVLRDLASLQVENNNEQIKALLQKYGLQVQPAAATNNVPAR